MYFNRSISGKKNGIEMVPSVVQYFEVLSVWLQLGNEEQQEKLLREWLDCCVTEGGMLVAMQKSLRRRNPPLVTQMVEKWLDRYRQIRPCASLSDGEEEEDEDEWVKGEKKRWRAHAWKWTPALKESPILFFVFFPPLFWKCKSLTCNNACVLWALW